MFWVGGSLTWALRAGINWLIPEKIGEMPVFPLDKHVSLSLIFALNQKSNIKPTPNWGSLPRKAV
jgi:hypothetical protein